jgi:hypothetical protein
MRADTELLQRNALIDYSVFLLQVDRNKMIADKMAQERPILYYDKATNLFRVTMKRVLPVTPDIVSGQGQSELDKADSSIASNEPGGGMMKPAANIDQSTDKLLNKSSTGPEHTDEGGLVGEKDPDGGKVKQKPKMANVFKKNVFRIVEKNELETYNSAGQLRGYADIESVDGEFRYKIGVIDFLTKYSKLKYIEN